MLRQEKECHGEEERQGKNGRTKGDLGELEDNKDSLKQLLTVTRITVNMSIFLQYLWSLSPLEIK